MVATAAATIALAMAGAWRRERGLRPARTVAADAVTLALPAVFDQVAIGIALLTPQGSTVRVNRRLVEMLGYSQDELLRRRLMDLTHPDDLPRSMAERARLLDGVESNTRLDKRYLHRNGQAVWVSVTGTMVPAQAGAPDLLVLVIDDLRDRPM